MNIDTLLTLDADDPALRRGIAELLGWRIERNEYRQKFYVHGPNGKFFDFTYWDIGDQMDDVWLKLEAEEIGPCEPLIPDWPHSVDAALGLCADDPRIWRVELTLWPAKMARADIWMKPPLDLDAPSDHYATMGGNEGEPKSPALAICRAWLASKR